MNKHIIKLFLILFLGLCFFQCTVTPIPIPGNESKAPDASIALGGDAASSADAGMPDAVSSTSDSGAASDMFPVDGNKDSMVTPSDGFLDGMPDGKTDSQGSTSDSKLESGVSAYEASI